MLFTHLFAKLRNHRQGKTIKVGNYMFLEKMKDSWPFLHKSLKNIITGDELPQYSRFLSHKIDPYWKICLRDSNISHRELGAHTQSIINFKSKHDRKYFRNNYKLPRDDKEIFAMTIAFTTSKFCWNFYKYLNFLTFVNFLVSSFLSSKYHFKNKSLSSQQKQ